MDDTIAAISTAAGFAARAIVRLSGPRSVEIAGRLFTGGEIALGNMGGFHSADGLVRISADIELPARAYLFRQPRSYTRQDVVEIHLPGSPAAAGRLLVAMIDAGARRAGPGEFTARAFLAGRIDLSQAEAVADVIAASDDAKLRAATAALGGRVHRLCSAAAEDLADALATVEASIDLAEEQIELAEPSELAGQLAELAGRLAGIAESAIDLPDDAELPQVVIAGRPNVGKSSLLNALTGTDRAITSETAGTTRDVLRGQLTLPCGAVVDLLDVAGFERSATTDGPDAAASDAAAAAVTRADMILLVLDATAEDATGAATTLLKKLRRINARTPLLPLVNKIDLVPSYAPPELTDDHCSPAVGTSAVTGEGLDTLAATLTETLHLAAERPADALGLHRRQRRCLQAAAEATDRARDLLAEADQIADVAELAAVELRDALRQLGAISGEVVTEDLLGIIFARFCVGK